MIASQKPQGLFQTFVNRDDEQHLKAFGLTATARFHGRCRYSRCIVLWKMEKPSSHEILLVEDDQMIRESLSEALQFEGFSVTTAENGADAIEKLREIKHPCLILLDLMMPVMNGWEFLSYRKTDDVLITIPVAVISAASDNAIKKTIGAERVFKKPLNITALFDWIEKYCGKSNAAAA